MCLQMCEPLLGFIDSWHMAARHPPESDVGAAELLEPIPALSEQLGVRGFVNVSPQRFDRFPLPASVCKRQTNPGPLSARALISSRRATNPAMTGSSSGAFMRAMST